MKNLLRATFILLLLLPGPIYSQPTLSWQIGVSGGILVSPLLFDVYHAPTYPDNPGEMYFGQEIFIPSLLVAGTVTSPLQGLTSTGYYLYNEAPLGVTAIVRSAPAASVFENNTIPVVIFGSSNGCELVYSYGLRQTITVAGGITAPPVLANIDLDNWREIVAVSDAGQLYAWNLSGFSSTPVSGFPINLGESGNGFAPVIANVNSSTAAEIIVTTRTGVHLLDNSGQYLNGWPIRHPGATISTSAVVGKVDTFGGNTRNIVYATDDGLLYRARPSGSFVGLPTNLGAPVDTSPILVDLNADGKHEILICTTDGKVHLLKPDGSDYPGWPVDLSHYTSITNRRETEAFSKLFVDPLVADIDGDQALEILIFLRDDGKMFAFRTNGTLENGYPVDLSVDRGTNSTNYAEMLASPAIADIDADGKLEMALGTFGDFGARSSIKVFELGATPASTALLPWPMYRQNPYRTGEAAPLDIFTPTTATCMLKNVFLQGYYPSRSDTVIVEFRPSAAVANATLRTRVVPVVATGDVEIVLNTPGSYYLVIAHRNHLPIVTSGAYNFSAGQTTTIDIAATNVIYTPAGSQPALYTNPGDGKRLLRGGDAAGGVNSGNGIVNIADFGVFAQNNGKSCSSAGWDRRADFNGDCVVNIADFGIFALNNGRTGYVQNFAY